MPNNTVKTRKQFEVNEYFNISRQANRDFAIAGKQTLSSGTSNNQIDRVTEFDLEQAIRKQIIREQQATFAQNTADWNGKIYRS